MNIFLVEVEILQLNTKTCLPEACFWKARGNRISVSTRFCATGTLCISPYYAWSYADAGSCIAVAVARQARRASRRVARRGA